MVVRAALNTARAFAVLHQAGHLVGDVNHGGVRISPDATVRLIDTDSFQVSHQGRTFLCEVGVQDFTPPELQGKAFKQVTRTANHDSFGLAVLIFQMLMNGRHPFAGRYSGSGEMPIEKAIPEFRYAYSSNAAAMKMQPPPLTPPAAAASPEVAGLWERAFGSGGAKPNGRPTAQDWVQALTKLEGGFVRCSQRSSHFYFGGYGSCPWCPIERAGIALFGATAAVIKKLGPGQFNLESVWRDITSAILPPLAAMPQPTVVPASQAVAAVGQRRRAWRNMGWAAGLAILVLGVVLNAPAFLLWAVLGFGMGAWVNSRGRANVTPITGRYQQAKTHYEGLKARWTREQSDTQLQSKQQQLRPLRDELLGLSAERERRYAVLMNNRQRHALNAYLDQFEIEKAKIPGVGAAKKAMLESFGVETAADVVRSKVLQVPGFGPALTDRLLKWRQKLEGQFHFNPAAAIDPRQVADLDRTIMSRRSQLEAELTTGRMTVLQLRQAALTRRQALESAMQEATRLYSQAAADAKAVGG
jgi:DNA-binding helix-hairpin-helix protein with protein kinase domain